MQGDNSNPTFSRRNFLKWGGTSLLSLGAPLSFFSAPDQFTNFLTGDSEKNISAPKLAKPQKAEKFISIYNTHTGESLKKCVFWADGQFDPQALKSINRLFRDHRTGKVYPIDQRLVALLHNIAKNLDTHKPIHLVSGYRSQETNAMLRESSYGVAKQSQHTVGRAADIFIEGRSLGQIQRIALSLKGGGVGRYGSFVHVDTGRIRRWGRMA